MFTNADEDDLFNPAASSHLVTLFGTSMNKLPGMDDSSLVYTPLKQPKQEQEVVKQPSKEIPQSTVFCTCFVELFKVVDKVPSAKGKCGLAIIGSDSLKVYEIIIYKSKKDIISRTKLTPDFVFILQNQNFAYFHDDRKQYWSVHFQNTADLSDFTKVLKNYNVKIQNTVQPAASSETEVKQPQNETNDQQLKQPLDVKHEDSDTASDSSTTQAKAKILSRMAKVGQSILPGNIASKSSEQSDSEIDKNVHRKPIKKKPRNSNHIDNIERMKPSINQVANIQPPMPQQFVNINGQFLPVALVESSLQNQVVHNPNQIYSNPHSSQISDSLHVFIAENRTHNCELRMNISQLSSKLDTVLSQLDKKEPGVKSNEPMSQSKNELEQNNELLNDLQEKYNSLHHTITAKEKQLELATQKTIEQENELQNYQRKCEHSQKQLQDKCDEYNHLQKKLETNEQTVKELREALSNKAEETRNFEKVANELQESLTKLENRLTTYNSNIDQFSRKLKQQINKLYQEIMANFEDETASFMSSHIKQILSGHLKNSTLAIIQEFNADFQATLSTNSVQTQSAPPVPNF